MFISEATIAEEMVVLFSTVSGLVSVDLACSIIRDRFRPDRITPCLLESKCSLAGPLRPEKKPDGIRPSGFQFCSAEDSSELHEKVRLENHVLAIPRDRVMCWLRLERSPSHSRRKDSDAAHGSNKGSELQSRNR